MLPEGEVGVLKTEDMLCHVRGGAALQRMDVGGGEGILC